MASQYVELQVLLEEKDDVLTLKVSQADAERAERDPEFLKELVNLEYERRSMELISSMNEKAASSSSSSSQRCDNEEVDSENGTSHLFIWSTACVYLLLSLYEEYEEQFILGAKRRQGVWETISKIMVGHGHTVTWAQCQSKMNGLKRTYKKILDHNNVSGNDRKSWPYFEKMNAIFGATAWAQPKALASEAGPRAGPSSCTSNTECNKPQTSTPSKRKLHTVFETYCDDMKAERDARRQEKDLKFERVLDQKERQHREKMEMLQLLVKSMSEPK